MPYPQLSDGLAPNAHVGSEWLRKSYFEMNGRQNRSWITGYHLARRPLQRAKKAYIGFIQNITAPPHGDVRPGLFLPSPGQGPNGARAERIGEEQAGSSAPHRVPAPAGVTVRMPGACARRAAQRREYHGDQSDRRTPHTSRGRSTTSRRIRKIFGNIHEISRNAEPHRGSARKL